MQHLKAIIVLFALTAIFMALGLERGTYMGDAQHRHTIFDENDFDDAVAKLTAEEVRFTVVNENTISYAHKDADKVNSVLDSIRATRAEFGIGPRPLFEQFLFELKRQNIAFKVRNEEEGNFLVWVHRNDRERTSEAMRKALDRYGDQ